MVGFYVRVRTVDGHVDESEAMEDYPDHLEKFEEEVGKNLKNLSHFNFDTSEGIIHFNPNNIVSIQFVRIDQES